MGGVCEGYGEGGGGGDCLSGQKCVHVQVDMGMKGGLFFPLHTPLFYFNFLLNNI